MRLQINEHWAVDWDGQCYTLIHFTVVTGEGKGAKKTKAENIGKLRENFCGYYGHNLKQALMGYTQKAALEGDGTVDVAGLMYRLDQIEDTIKKLHVGPPLTEPTTPPDAPAAKTEEPKAAPADLLNL